MHTPARAHAPHKTFLQQTLRLVKQYQPLLTVLGCVVSFFFGTLYKMAADRAALQEQTAHEWRDALLKIEMDGGHQMNDALLIQSFESKPGYALRARQIEFQILERINDPEAFDTVYFTLQSRTRQEQLGDLEELDRSLSRQLRMLLNQAVFPARERALDRNQQLASFLLDPARYLNQPQAIARADMLLYELDSVSGGFACVLKEHAQGCPALHPTGQEDAEMILVNRDFGGVFHGSAQPSFFKTCTVQALYGTDRKMSLSCTP